MVREAKAAGASAAPGQMVRHSIDLVELPDGTRVSLPIVLLNGVGDGPRLYLGAGIHGDEENGVHVVSRVLAQLRPEQLSGSVVCVPVQNPLAFQFGHRIPLGLYLKSPLDQAPIDPWSCFPGNAEGNITEMLTARLFELITSCDYVLDIHTPTRGGRYVPITILPHPSLGAAFKRSEELALAFGSGYIMRTDKGMYVRDGNLSVEATRAGIPTLMFELGEGGRLEEEITSIGVRCVLNLLRFLKMIPGEAQKPRESVLMKEFVGLRARRGGFLSTEVSLGTRVKKGGVLARISTIQGQEAETIVAPVDGVFVRATTFPTVASGERAATLGLE